MMVVVWLLWCWAYPFSLGKLCHCLLPSLRRLFLFDSRRFGDKLKEIIKVVVREGFYRPDNEFLFDVALAFFHPVNLTYRDFHDVG